MTAHNPAAWFVTGSLSDWEESAKEPAAFRLSSAQTESAVAPVTHVIAIHSQTEQVGGNESELRGPNSDDADDGAVSAGDDPTLPFVFADQVRREQGERA